MNTIGYLLILLGVFTTRQASKGRRIGDVPGDLGAMLTALVSLDTATMKAVLARSGDATSDVSVSTSPSTSNSSVQQSSINGGSSDVLSKAQSLAATANYRYDWGATGPNAYDCSGLVWQALKQTGIYTGPRFTSQTFVSAMGNRITQVNDPQVGDFAVWSSHIGIVDGNGTMFSALNSTDGIKHSPISYGPKGETVKYYRLVSGALQT